MLKSGLHKTMFFSRTPVADDAPQPQPEAGGFFDLDGALAACLSLTAALRQVHSRTELHHAICPANVRINDDGSIELRYGADMPLAYISPEQTGRMNRGVDYRSDYYSLGVVFYELFTAHLPFESDNVIEMVHSHIAKRAVPPIQLNPEIPKPLSDIVMKLLAKNAEDRYQSLDGLWADLQSCQSALLESGLIASFELGRKDICDRLQIPQKLYGRESQVAQMINAFHHSATGSAELLLITGYSGIGKSSLVNELQKPVVAKRGYFVTGKFDQFRRDIPYHAIAQTFRDLVRQILSESESQIAEWRVKILQALGPNGQLMIDAVPDLEFIIGKQPEVLRMGPTESQNRFNFAIQNLVGVFTRPQHPVVMLLDDLQWADPASLKLMHYLMTGLEQPALLLIGAYRDNEVEAGDPILQTIEAIGKQAKVSTIEVTALPQDSVVALVADTLKSSHALVERLARLIFRKTLGNPFFVGQFIKNLHNEKLLQFVDGKWQWDIEQIEAVAVTDNVIDLLGAELARLPQATRQILTLAACVGNSFDLNTLATVAEMRRGDVAALLQPALHAGLALSSDPGFGAPESQLFPFRFLHDRVQQAAYWGIPLGQRQAVHLQIGRLLLENTSLDQRDEKLFHIVQHLNEGQALLTDNKERLALAELNLQAARKAKTSIAYDTVLKHASIGIALLDASGDKRGSGTSPLYFSLQLEQMEASYLNRQFDAVDRIGSSALAYATDNFQRALVLDVQLQSYLYQDRHVEALGLAMKTLQMLGIEIPAVVSRFQLKLRLWKIKVTLSAWTKAELLEFPLQKDPVEILKQQVLSRAVSACYVARPSIFPVLIFERLNVNLKSGCATPMWPISLAGYAMVLIQSHQEIARGCELGQIALALARNKHAAGYAGHPDVRLEYAVHALILHWRQHLATTVAPLHENYLAGLQSGEFEYGVYSLATALRTELIIGRKLPQLLEKMQAGLRKAGSLRQKTSSDAIRTNIAYVSALMGMPTEDDDNWIKARNITRLTLLLWNLFGAAKAYMFLDFDGALKKIGVCETYIGSAICMATLPVYHLYHSLCLLACYPAMDGAGQRAALAKVHLLQKKLRLWARHAPMNNLHKWQLVEAERWRLRGNARKAERYYDLALRGARDYGFLNEEALANEMASRFYLAAGRQTNARVSLEEAHARYAEWGATAKLLHLEETYPHLLSRVTERRQGGNGQQGRHAEQRLDLETIIRASQTLSGEVQLDRLLEKLMRLLIENAGAQKGVLFLQKDGMLSVQGRAQDDAISVRQGTPAEACGDVSLAIINYVRRRREKVMLGDAGKDNQFKSDPYIQREHPKSVLCLPLKKQDEVVGILYLENNLAVDAFTPEHNELLGILSTQIAISLENAELYNELEQKIEARTKALSLKNAELSQTLHSLRKMQKQLVESEKLASLGQLVAGIAHEINTPVGIGVTAASTLAQQTETLQTMYQDGSMKRSDLDSYVNSAGAISKLMLSNMERAATLIQSFKDVAIDQTSEERRSFGLKSYIEDVLLNLSPTLRRAERQVTLDCADDIEVDSYPGALAQILTNFVMNALLHAFDEGAPGAMAIAVRAPDADSVELSFSDTGKGIPEKNLTQIFDPFFTTMRGRGGSGLGLNIVHNLVTGSLQGQISVYSKIGEGTTFTIGFPRNPIRKAPGVDIGGTVPGIGI